LLETIRAYAAERLATAGTGTHIRGRHAAHYLALAENADEQLRGPDQRAWLERLTTEQPNLRAALAHCVATADVTTAWRWIAAMTRFWESIGQRSEAAEWIGRATALGDPPATPSAVAGLCAASEILQPSDARGALELATRASDLAAGLGDLARARAARALGIGAMWIRPELTLPALHEALGRLGDDQPWERATTMRCLVQAEGELAEAIRWGQASAALFRRLGDHTAAANALFIMAQRAIHAGGDGYDVHEWLTESRALAQAAASESDLVHASVGFAQLAWMRAEKYHAAQLMQECLPVLRRLGDQRCTGRALLVLGQHAREQGELSRAEELLQASIEAIILAGQSFVLVNALEALAAVRAAQGSHADAAVLLGTAHAVRAVATRHLRPLDPPDDDLRSSLVIALGAAEFEAARGEGAGLSPAQALQRASSHPLR
jgi:hypothetical protein